ncbi:MAG TPA: CPBP family intramembrane glutamic endopeptidase [Candidatus Angelobacter sp.]|nr:CPBP family intramembrane glutamic endopeptidase [Candidatus Angelobacter sp.]
MPGWKGRVKSGERRLAPLLAIAAGYALIMITIWSPRPAQRWLFWIDASFFFCAAVVAFRRQPFGFPKLDFSLVSITTGAVLAGLISLVAAQLGTLHGLFGTPRPFLHAATYLTWAIVQQWIQQAFFFVRLERVLQRGLLASFTTAVLFGLAHLPNPVLAPLTFLGGWILSELYRRYRSVLPLGMAHGLVGLAIAVSVPDHIHHHMRVGLGYLLYRG